MAKIAPLPGWVRVFTKDPPLSFKARLSDERPNIESGFGGWVEVPRPRRRPLTTWQSGPAVRLSLPILFDGLGQGNRLAGTGRRGDERPVGHLDNSVEDEIAILQRMALPTSSNGDPPIVRIESTGSAIPYQDRNWVLDGLNFGEGLMNEKGNRVRQQVTLSLLEHLMDAGLLERSAANRRRSAARAQAPKAGAQSKRVNAKAGKAKAGAATRSLATEEEFGSGEDLLRLAARELGDANRWVEIARLNGIRDPRSIRQGQVLRLP